MLTKSHLILFVRDQARSTRFFRAVLAMAPTLEVPGMTEFELCRGAVLGLMPESGIARLLGGAVDPAQAAGVPRAELYLVVDDVRAYHGRAIAAGARSLSDPAERDWGHEVSYCADLDGHVLAFACERRGA